MNLAAEWLALPPASRDVTGFIHGPETYYMME
jgi:hypothetical protein